MSKRIAGSRRLNFSLSANAVTIREGNDAGKVLVDVQGCRIDECAAMLTALDEDLLQRLMVEIQTLLKKKEEARNEFNNYIRKSLINLKGEEK